MCIVECNATAYAGHRMIDRKQALVGSMLSPDYAMANENEKQVVFGSVISLMISVSVYYVT